MINNINQVQIALMGKNAKKGTDADTNSDAFQALLAAFMNQGMSIQGNNMAGLQGGLQEQLVDMVGANSGSINTADVFGINPALMRMLSGLNGGTGDVQADNGSGLREFDELMGVFLGEKGQEASIKDSNTKTVENLLTDLAQESTAAAAKKETKPVSIVENAISNIAEENMATTQEISNMLLDVKENAIQNTAEKTAQANKDSEAKSVSLVENAISNTSQGNMTITREISDMSAEVKEGLGQSTVENQNALTAMAAKDTDNVKESKNNLSNGNKVFAAPQEVEMKGSNKQDTEVKSTLDEKPQDKQFIVTRPEVLKILKGETTKTIQKADGDVLNAAVTRQENSGIVKGIAHKVEGFEGLASKKQNEDMTELKQDGSIPTADIRSIQPARAHEAAFEVKQPVVASKEDILSQVLDKVKLISGKDMSELHISLKPESLGEVSIKLIMEKGAMTARITVENSQVKSLIDSNLPQIKESLRSQNIDVASLNVSVNIGQGDLPYNQDFSFNRWNFNKKGNSRTRNSEGDEQVQTIKPREIYTQKSGLNLLA